MAETKETWLYNSLRRISDSPAKPQRRKFGFDPVAVSIIGCTAYCVRCCTVGNRGPTDCLISTLYSTVLVPFPCGRFLMDLRCDDINYHTIMKAKSIIIVNCLVAPLVVQLLLDVSVASWQPRSPASSVRDLLSSSRPPELPIGTSTRPCSPHPPRHPLSDYSYCGLGSCPCAQVRMSKLAWT